ncbi:hypothetical protein ACEU2D_01210 [Brevibacillus laterosporus]|uniref:hypothetical protein n=1 Tax=Brevibacillus laterosporus TaxID=1465 RepID=UPI0003B2415D|nr:hypothetical protein [Brevibacillus laterosporus]ERM19789.1 hypothetical protein P615_09315 [Brevibacillus laterosporus PE36]
MKKKIVSLAVVFMTMISSIGFAAQSKEHSDWGEDSSLNEQEIQKLIYDVGIEESEINDYPVQVLHQLIQNDAKKIATNYKVVKEEAIQGLSGEDIDGGTLELRGTAFEEKSDKKGKKKFYLYGKYEWTDSPRWGLTDGISIGYPVSNKWTLPMSANGKVKDFALRYCHKPENVDKKWKCSKSYKPTDWDPGVGVGGEIDLEAMPNNNLHKGYIGQYVYTDERNSGSTNIKFQYGHQTWGGNVEFAIFPAGLSIKPQSVSEVIDFGIEFDY